MSFRSWDDRITSPETFARSFCCALEPQVWYHDTMADETQPENDGKSWQEDIANEVNKARAAKELRMEGFRVLKDPGELSAGNWHVGRMSYVTYGELHKEFGDSWVWGPNVWAMKNGKTFMATQWAILDPLGREWSLIAEWKRSEEVPKDKNADWDIYSTSCDYRGLGEWLSRLLGRPIPITCMDPDQKGSGDEPHYGIVQVYGNTGS